MSNINDELKKIFLAGVGAVATTAEKSKDVIDNLIEKGQLTIEQGKVLNEELKRNMKSAKENMAKNDNVENDISKTHEQIKSEIYANINKLSKEELLELKDKLTNMQEQYDK